MSRDWLLYLDDLIASAEKIARLVAGRQFEAVAQEAPAVTNSRPIFTIVRSLTPPVATAISVATGSSC